MTCWRPYAGRISLWGGKGMIGVILGTLSVVAVESFVIITGAGLFYGLILKGLIILLMVLWDNAFRLKRTSHGLS